MREDKCKKKIVVMMRAAILSTFKIALRECSIDEKIVAEIDDYKECSLEEIKKIGEWIEVYQKAKMAEAFGDVIATQQKKQQAMENDFDNEIRKQYDGFYENDKVGND